MANPRNNWDSQLEFGLPDSRLGWLRRESTMVTVGRMQMETCFCANCGCDGGAVTPEWAAHVFYLCEACAFKHGNIDGLTEIPEPVVQGKEPLIPRV